MVTQERLEKEADLAAIVKAEFDKAGGDPDKAADEIEKKLPGELEKRYWEGFLLVLLLLWMADEEFRKAVDVNDGELMRRRYQRRIEQATKRHARTLARQLRETNRKKLRQAARKAREAAIQAARDARAEALRQERKRRKDAANASRRSGPSGNVATDTGETDQDFAPGSGKTLAKDPMQALQRMLERLASEQRAISIGITEVTRAITLGEEIAVEVALEHGFVLRSRWMTAEDDLVCNVCGPLHGTEESIWRVQFPFGSPAHNRCRCYRKWYLVRNSQEYAI